MPAGRPTKYRYEFCQHAVNFLADGRTLAELAKDLNVDRDAIKNWRKKNPEFDAAIKKGLTHSEAYYDNLLRLTAAAHAAGKIKGGNITGLIFLMKSRFRDSYGDQLQVVNNGFEFKPLPTFGPPSDEDK